MKLEFSWGSGVVGYFLSLSSGVLMAMNRIGEQFHQKYGGKTYYTSKSGLSGAGYITHQKDLVLVGGVGRSRSNITWTKFVHDGINFELTSNGEFVVIRCCKTCVFVYPHEVAKIIAGWDSIQLERRDYKYLVGQPVGFETEYQWVYNPNGFKTDIKRFMDFEDVRRSVNLPEFDGQGQTPAMCIMHMGCFDGKLYHRNIDGFYDLEIPSMEGNLPEGWVGNAGGWWNTFYKVDGEGVHLMVERPRCLESKFKYIMRQECLAQIEFFSNTEGCWRRMWDALLIEERDEFLGRCILPPSKTQQEIIDMLQHNQSRRLCVKHFEECRVCVPMALELGEDGMPFFELLHLNAAILMDVGVQAAIHMALFD